MDKSEKSIGNYRLEEVKTRRSLKLANLHTFANLYKFANLCKLAIIVLAVKEISVGMSWVIKVTRTNTDILAAIIYEQQKWF